METTYSAEATDIDAPVHEAIAERAGKPITVRVQPGILRLKRPGDTGGNYQPWAGVSWTLRCANAEEAIGVREALRVLFDRLEAEGSAAIISRLTSTE